MHPGTLKDIQVATRPARVPVARVELQQRTARVDAFATALIAPVCAVLAREGNLSGENVAESVWRLAQAIEAARPVPE